MFPDSHARAMARYSPLKSNIDDMVAATERLQVELEYVVDDSEVYGVLTEDTFLENCPEILKQMERISALVQNSTRDLSFDDEAFEPVESSGLALALYTFLATHAAILSTLTTHSPAIKSLGPYYDSLSRSVNAQRLAVLRFRAAVDAKYADVKAQTVQQWTEFNGTMDSMVERYPLPAEIVVVE